MTGKRLNEPRTANAFRGRVMRVAVSQEVITVTSKPHATELHMKRIAKPPTIDITVGCDCKSVQLREGYGDDPEAV